MVGYRSKKQFGLLQLFRELDPRPRELSELISLLWCTYGFGEMHTIESVLPTFLGSPGIDRLRYATPFPVAEAQSIPKTILSVNAAVVRCHKKPDLIRRPGFSQPGG